ncbi:3-hydroxyacyl-CoA dehydrogenase NAD-binding domain-containing protein [Hoeflea alexandrii]|uniref:3-hydroxyacyl-CoA dehydrogenase NAD-binding domain-containing protein n=1 Tax=Hoeflea alexandrii TaxID=288436 RepID=UPI0022AE6348|nr:3-hydroxyacyl-CoA dehydrogenase NAD-binding domain-containing protein [Hoeflea alexandrii]MCZ4290682.1 3-hydroxyacyl-CoA dehydrogenase NAD-binding domain-containing protein [Hoeflea alexandrii]
MAGDVNYTVDGNVAVVTINNPPVNAFGFDVRHGVIEAMNRAEADPAVTCVVLTGGGRTFSGGADITEFGKTPREPSLPDVNTRCETMSKPVVAAIHGFAFGGGLEVSLSCHGRIASADAKLALPEVKLGLIPGAGGTQRLPRLIGPEAALDVIVPGNPVGAKKALEVDILDRVAGDDLLADAKAFALELAAAGEMPKALRDREDKLEAARRDPSALDAHAANLTKKARGLEAPLACVRAVRMALDTPFDEALAKEREMFIELMNGEQSKAQRHLFFAEREANKVPGIDRDVKPRKVSKAAVIGAGTMGGGIAMALANGGVPVTILEMNQEAIDRGMAVIQRNYDTSVKRGSISAEERDRRLGRLSTTTNYDDIADADLVIEAVFEEMSVKKVVFGKLDEVMKPGAILASNTSYLDVDAIAQMTKRPSDVLGMHFFSPANVMKLLEIVRGKETAPDVIATALALGKQIGKVPVVVGVCHGFVGNRMLSSRSAENESLLLEGASPSDVDKAFLDFGFSMGPFAMGDLAGLDIGWRTRKSLGETAAIGDALCEAGRYGQKTGKGFYSYEDGPRDGKPDPWVDALIEEKAKELGVNRRSISADEIIERTIYPMINEGARILEEGIALRPSDIDIVWINGYAFPIGKGGPMFWAEQAGLAHIVERLEYWHGKTGNPVFEPAELLRKAAKTGLSLASAMGGKDEVA